MDDPYTDRRLNMVKGQIQKRGLTNPRVLEAMRTIPRHLFVEAGQQDDAYEDTPLPLGWGQTISQPYIVALMSSLLQAGESDTILEIGTGSGYQAAVLSRLAGQVYTVELLPALAARARKTLDSLDIHNVTIEEGDGSQGLPEYAPYAGILVAAAAPQTPAPLLEQLCPGGRLVIPVGSHGNQVLQVWQRQAAGWDIEEIIPVAFVPLRGALGWQDEDRYY